MSRSDEPCADHAATQQLLPWLLTGTLDDAERDLVQRHLGACAACRADLARERRLRALGQSQPALDPDAALARLAPRLESPPGRVRTVLRWAHGLAANDSHWLRSLAAAQLAINVALLALLLARPGGDEAPYRLMGASEPVQGDLVVGFRPDTPEHELRRILQESGTRVLDGPTVTGAYVLAARGTPPARALAHLRAEPAVTLAQPLGADGRP